MGHMKWSCKKIFVPCHVLLLSPSLPFSKAPDFKTGPVKRSLGYTSADQREYNSYPMHGKGGDTVIKAYILVSLVPGLESNTIPQIDVLPGVQETDLVFGRWDVVVQVKANSIPDLSQMVINQIRGLQGVQTTETLIGGVI